MKIEKKHLIVVGVLVVVAIVIFVWGKYVGKKNPNAKKARVEVDIDNNGTVKTYDPTPIVDELHEALIAWAFPFNGVYTKRCALLASLLELSASSPAKFMAVVYGYEKKYKTTLIQAIKACNLNCKSSSEYMSINLQIKERIVALSEIFKPKN